MQGPITPEPVLDEVAIQEAIAQRARELWETRGRRDGHAEEDWKQAELEIRSRLDATVPPAKRRIVIKAGDTIYTGEYDPATADWYRPGDLKPGAEIRLQFQDDLMVLNLPPGRQLRARIVKQVKTAAAGAQT